MKNQNFVDLLKGKFLIIQYSGISYNHIHTDMLNQDGKYGKPSASMADIVAVYRKSVDPVDANLFDNDHVKALAWQNMLFFFFYWCILIYMGYLIKKRLWLSLLLIVFKVHFLDVLMDVKLH